MSEFACRPGCAACCIVPGITAPIPGMPEGKPPGVACIQLDEQGLCKLFGHPDRPAVCLGIRPEPSWCGASDAEAFDLISALERSTAPARQSSAAKR